MTKIEKRTFSLPKDQSAYIDAKVASGGYASSSEVVREGLRALQQRDAAIERWLREEVAPALGEMDAHPEQSVPLDDALDEIENLIKDHEAKKAS